MPEQALSAQKERNKEGKKRQVCLRSFARESFLMAETGQLGASASERPFFLLNSFILV